MSVPGRGDARWYSLQMVRRSPTQIAKEIEAIQALVVAGGLSHAAGRAAIEQLTGELVEAAAPRTVPDRSASADPPGGAGPSVAQDEGRTPGRHAEPAPAAVRANPAGRVGARPSTRYTSIQVATATFLGTPFAGSALGAANAFRNGQAAMGCVRLLGAAVYVVMLVCVSALNEEHPLVAICFLNTTFALFWSTFGERTETSAPWWHVVAASAGAWAAILLGSRLLFSAVLSSQLTQLYPEGGPAPDWGEDHSSRPSIKELAGLGEAPARPAIALDALVEEAIAAPPPLDLWFAEVRAKRHKAAGDCLPQYVGACVPPSPPDLDCKDITGPIRVVGVDVHKLDRDGDGWACKGK